MPTQPKAKQLQKYNKIQLGKKLETALLMIAPSLLVETRFWGEYFVMEVVLSIIAELRHRDLSLAVLEGLNHLFDATHDLPVADKKYKSNIDV